MKFLGYKRPDGKVGVRNHVLILPSVICSNQLAHEIARVVDGCVPFYWSGGCLQLGEDAKLSYKTLVSSAANPNVGAVLVVGNGCETFVPTRLADDIKEETGKDIRHVIIQDEGGTLRTFAKGCRIAKELVSELSKQKREEAEISELVIGAECGGSDATSGLASNPACGVVADMFVGAGGTYIFSETTELIGADHLLAERAVSKEVKHELLNIVHRRENWARKLGVEIRGTQPTPGNIEGGLTTIEEKSLGCIFKGGTSLLVDVLGYADVPKKRGLNFMDTPGFDVESITGMVAGGAQIVLFTTGRGSVVGNPIAPVIKITANSSTFEKMRDNIDVDASEIIDGTKTIQQVGEDIFKEVITVANGKKTKAEILRHYECAVIRVNPTM